MSDMVMQILMVGGQIFLVLVLSLIGLRLGRYIIDQVLKVREGKKQAMDPAHINTLNSLLKSTLVYVIYFFMGTMILSLLGVPIASLLAGAGIVGLALGFGAQALVKDVIAGFFILFENQFTVGEMINAGGAEGIVDEVGLRTTKIRTFGGEVHIIRNGLIDTVVNYSRNNMRVRVFVSVAYEENIARVMDVIKEVCEEVAKEHDGVVETPVPLGVSDLGSSGIDIMVVGRAKPMTSWGVERLLRQRIKERFDEEGIEIPYPKRVLYTGGTLERPEEEHGPETVQTQ